jgi:hypothetical protein
LNGVIPSFYHDFSLNQNEGLYTLFESMRYNESAFKTTTEPFKTSLCYHY